MKLIKGRLYKDNNGWIWECVDDRPDWEGDVEVRLIRGGGVITSYDREGILCEDEFILEHTRCFKQRTGRHYTHKDKVYMVKEIHQ